MYRCNQNCSLCICSVLPNQIREFLGLFGQQAGQVAKPDKGERLIDRRAYREVDSLARKGASGFLANSEDLLVDDAFVNGRVSLNNLRASGKGFVAR